jgi:hypothetical protein
VVGEEEEEEGKEENRKGSAETGNPLEDRPSCVMVGLNVQT